MNNQHTYWNHNGTFQQASETLAARVPQYGEATAHSPVELFRRAVNVYYDLYNNGFMNAEIRIPPLLAEIDRVQHEGYLQDADFTTALKALQTYYEAYEQASTGETNRGFAFSDEEEDEEDWLDTDDHYPSLTPLYATMETLIDGVITYAEQFPDPSRSIHDQRAV